MKADPTTIKNISQEELAIRYQALVDSMNDGFGVINKEGIFTYVNSHFAKMLEYSMEEIVGKSLLDFVSEDNKKIVRENIRQRMQGEATQYEVEWTRNDGEQVPTIVSGAPMVDDEGNHMGSFAVITDITQKFTLFRYDGIPVRATLDVSFLQAKEKGKYPGQNPTTVNQSGYRRRMVNEGDTIDWIAFEEYGDSAMWRFIADTNNLDNPAKLKPGQVLAIAPPD